MRARDWLIGGAVVGIAWIGAEPARAEGLHTNKEVGYKIRVPKDFELTRDSIGSDVWSFFRDRHIVDTFRCSQELAIANDFFGYRRTIATFYFPARTAADLAREQAEREQQQREAGEETVTLRGGQRSYQSFKDYASDNIKGFYFTEEKPAKIAGFPATVYEMTFEKLTSVPQRWLACAYQIPGGEFAVLCSCTEQHFKKFKSEMANVFDTFGMLAADGLRAPEVDSGIKLERGDDVNLDELAPEAVVKFFAEQKAKAFAKALANLGQGWRSFETEHFLVLYECDPAYAKQASGHAEAVRAWLDKQFASIGTRPVQSAILRIHAQESSTGGITITFTSGRIPPVAEIDFARPTSRGWTAEFESLSTNLLSHYFSQKNGELWDRMPRWLQDGLREVVDDAAKKGSTLAFEPDQWERDQMVDAFLAQKKAGDASPTQMPLKPLRTLMTMTGEEMWDGDNWRYAGAQCGSVVRFLVLGPGKSHAKFGKVVPLYLGHLYDLVEEVEQRLDAEREERAANEAAAANLSDEERLKREDEEYKKKRASAFDKIEKELLEKALDQTFAGWTDSDWKALDRMWLSYADGKIK